MGKSYLVSSKGISEASSNTSLVSSVTEQGVASGS